MARGAFSIGRPAVFNGQGCEPELTLDEVPLFTECSPNGQGFFQALPRDDQIALLSRELAEILQRVRFPGLIAHLAPHRQRFVQGALGSHQVSLFDQDPRQVVQPDRNLRPVRDLATDRHGLLVTVLGPR